MTVKYSISDWQDHFENNRTRQLQFMTWVPIPNRMDGDGYTELLDHPNGAAHFGAWVALVEVASKCHPRGTLVREGDRPYDIASLSRVTRIRGEVFDEAIPRLISIGWLTSQVVASSTDTTITQASAGETQSSAPLEERNGTERNGKRERAASAAAVSQPGELPGFDSWWKQWPAHERKTGKSECRRKWERKGLETIAEQVIAALGRCKASRDWTKDDGAFIPMPMSWLNKTPWETSPNETTAPRGTAAPEGAEFREPTDEELAAYRGGES